MQVAEDRIVNKERFYDDSIFMHSINLSPYKTAKPTENRLFLGYAILGYINYLLKSTTAKENFYNIQTD